MAVVTTIIYTHVLNRGPDGTQRGAVVKLTVAKLAAFLTLGLCAAPLAADAQSPAKGARIGVLTLAVWSSTPLAEAFLQGLREHGYLEGQNIVLEHRYAEGKADRLPALAAELVRLKVDVIVTQSDVAALAAKHATQTIPIVMAIAGDPVKAGVVASLARPGGNVTGLTLVHPELSGKRLQLLKEVVPKTTVVAVIWNPTNRAAAGFLRETEAAARSLGLKLHAIEARGPAELDAAFKAVADARPTAFFTIPNGIFADNVTRIVEFATKSRLPGVFPNREFPEAGGLMSYGPKTLGLTIPASVRARADQIID
jgi:putative ABC transport system substrate-binding protein